MIIIIFVPAFSKKIEGTKYYYTIIIIYYYIIIC